MLVLSLAGITDWAVVADGKLLLTKVMEVRRRERDSFGLENVGGIQNYLIPEQENGLDLPYQSIPYCVGLRDN